MKKPQRPGRRPKAPSRSLPARCWRLVRWPLLVLVLALLTWVVYLDIQVRDKFDGRKWAMPARVYAQPMELYVGKALTEADLRHELKMLEYRPVERLQGPGQWRRPRPGTIELATRSYRAGGRSEPERVVQLQLQGGHIADLQVVQGEPASLIALEPALVGGIYPQRQEDRELIQLKEVPPLLGEALIAVEDRGFIEHMGLSPRAILRAALVNARAGRVVQGGSTLTQQLVKNFFLDDSRTLGRKLTEAVMSLLLELHYSKAEILETYMNEVYLGQSGPRQIHGFGLASRHYFGRPLQKLDAAQIALLVGVVKGASYYNPWRNPERARERRNLVLDVLQEQGLLKPAEYRRARAAPLGVVAASQRQLHEFPAFIDLVKRQLQEDYSDEDLSSEGLKIYTTLSLTTQRHAEKALASRLQRLEQQHQLAADGLQGAVVVTSVGSGEVEAVVGDRQVKFAGFNRALDARRPIGSLVKPAVLLAALQSDQSWHLASMISDAPVTVAGPDNSLWQPQNFDRESHGDLLLIDALTHSYNQAMARLGMTVGLQPVLAALGSLGIEEEIPPLPSLLLGAVPLSPLSVSTLYHTLANDGVAMPLRAIRSVETAQGERLQRYPLTMDEPVSSDAIVQVQYAMQAVMAEGTGQSAYRRLPRTLALAGKTGTTNDQRDSWFAGFSGRHLAVVWVGRDDNGPTPLTGASGALQVWTDLLAELPTTGLDIFQSGSIDYLWVDGDNGRLSDEHCRGARLLPFTADRRPTQRADCDWVENPVLHWMKKWFR